MVHGWAKFTVTDCCKLMSFIIHGPILNSGWTHSETIPENLTENLDPSGSGSGIGVYMLHSVCIL
jgi:hypothetical protein